LARRTDLRLLGVDYGRARTGLALSDPEGRLAFPLETLRPRGLDDLAARLAETAAGQDVSGIVLGYPRHLDGRPGDLAGEVEELAERLRSRGLEVILWDERLTSWEAERLAREAPGRKGGRIENLDALAATVLLQSYLDEIRHG
jgi:putative Holliday junction resolvase